MGSRYVVAGGGGGGGGGGGDHSIDLESGISKIDEAERSLRSGLSDEQVKLLHAGRNLSRFADGQLYGDEESKNKSSGMDAEMVVDVPTGKASSQKHPKPPRHPKSSSAREAPPLAKSKRRLNKRARKTNNCGADLGALIITVVFCIVIIRHVLS